MSGLRSTRQAIGNREWGAFGRKMDSLGNMNQELPHRCPHCHALVVDRRSATCTTCRKELPAEWIMSKDQAAKMAQHAETIKTIDAIDPYPGPYYR
jgi:ribosomal protein L37AE/L43A